jgi:DNA-binding response OmpR family regulator
MVSSSEKNFKIVILSENVNFRNILASKLRLEGFFVELASGGFHLMHIFEEQKSLDMVIFNEDMFDMPAHEAIAMLRNYKSKTELPILFVSKNNDEAEIYEVVLSGANEFIVQTANFLPIIERAHKYFEKKSPAAA